VAPDEPNVTTGAYPLARAAYAYVNRPPKGRGRADVEVFLRYALGPAGQGRLGAATGYLALPPSAQGR
jgi:ABC-type phosphate transport system substrate-binding protein